MTAAILDFRLARAGATPGIQFFTPEARTLLLEASDGLPRRLTMVAHVAMQEAADRASTLVTEDHVRAAITARGLRVRPKPPVVPPPEPVAPAIEPNGLSEYALAEPQRGFFSRLFARRPT
jgi:hypothetical protein